MRINRRKRPLRALLTTGTVTALALWGCSDSTSEKLAAAKLAEGCVLSSDCAAPLVCVFQLCHKACETDVDCPLTERCVLAVEPGVENPDGLKVCQLPEELACKRDKDCPGYEVCGVDFECRDACTTGADCVTTQICAKSGQCASTEPGKDHIDAAGNILQSGGSGGSGGGESSSGGASGGVDTGVDSNAMGGSGGTTNSGSGGSQTGAAAGTLGSTSGGVTSASGGVSTIGGGAGDSHSAEAGAGGASTTYVETSDGIEAQPNDTREQALPLEPSPSVWLNGANDQDWFYVDAPDDGKAHLLSIRFVQESGTSTAFFAYSSDFTQVGKYQPNAGTTGSSVYFSMGPHTRTLVQVYSASGLAGRVVLDWQLTDEADPYAHADRASATPIELGTEIRAQLLNRYVSGSDHSSADWYQLDLAAGDATVRVSSAPGVHLSMTLVDANNVQRQMVTSGVDVTGDFTFSLTSGGHYYLRLNDYNISAKETDTAAWAVGAEPTYMSQQYVFQVLQ